MDDPLAFMAHNDLVMMYYHEAMKAHNKAKFVKTMKHEIDNHTRQGHWQIVRWNTKPKGTQVYWHKTIYCIYLSIILI